jgi:hypothetical protein
MSQGEVGSPIVYSAVGKHPSSNESLNGNGVGFILVDDSTGIIDYSGAVTIEFSIQSTTGLNGKVLGDRPTTNDSGMEISIGGGDDNVDFRGYGSAGLSVGTLNTGNISDQQWHDCCVQRDAAGVWTTFIDGTPSDSGSDGLLTLASSVLFRLFDVREGGLSPFAGKLDFIRITNGIARYSTLGYTPSLPFDTTQEAGYPPLISMVTNTPDGWKEILPRTKLIANWVPGQLTYPQQMVVDQGWTGVALAETTERPAPQPIGDSYNPAAGAVFDPSNFQTLSVEVRNVYTVISEFFTEAFALNVVAENIGLIHILTVIIDGIVVGRISFIPEAAGAVTLGTSAIIVTAGTTVEVSVEVNNTAGNQRVYWAEDLGFWTGYSSAEFSTVQGQKDGGVLTDDAYGIDILVQPADISQDYKIISAPTGATAGGGGGGGAQYLNDLLDVTLSSPANQQIMMYNGAQWVNVPRSPVTTKGDLYTYSTEDTRLPVGSPDYKLTPDPNFSTGLKWQLDFVPYPNKPAGEPLVLVAFGDVNVVQGKSVTNTPYESLYTSNPNVFEWGTDPIAPAGYVWRVPDILGPAKSDFTSTQYCGLRQGSSSSAAWILADTLQKYTGRDVYMLNIGAVGFLLSDSLMGESGFWSFNSIGVGNGSIVAVGPGQIFYSADDDEIWIHKTQLDGTDTEVRNLNWAIGSIINTNAELTTGSLFSDGIFTTTSVGDFTDPDLVKVSVTVQNKSAYVAGSSPARQMHFYSPTGTQSEFIDARIKEALGDVAFPGDPVIDTVMTIFGSNDANSSVLGTEFSRQWIAQLRNPFETAEYADPFRTHWHAVDIPWDLNNLFRNDLSDNWNAPLLFQGYNYVDKNTNERVRVHATEQLDTFQAGTVDFAVLSHTQLGYNVGYAALIGPTPKTFTGTQWETIANPDPLNNSFDIFSVNYGGRVAINVEDPNNLENVTFFMEDREPENTDGTFRFASKFREVTTSPGGEVVQQRATIEASIHPAIIGSIGFSTLLSSHQMSVNSGFSTQVGNEAGGNNGASFFRQQWNSASAQMVGLKMAPISEGVGELLSEYLTTAKGQPDPGGTNQVVVNTANGKMYHGAAALTASESAWVKEEAFPISKYSTSTIDAMWKTIHTHTMVPGDKLVGEMHAIADRTDAISVYGATQAFTAYYDGGANMAIGLLDEAGPTPLNIRLITSGDDLIFQVKGTISQDWDWILLLFLKDF